MAVLQIWDLRDGRCVRTIDTKSIVNSIMLSSDGSTVAVGNQDGGIRLFDVRNGAKLVENTSLHSAAVTGVQVREIRACMLSSLQTNKQTNNAFSTRALTEGSGY